MKSSKKNKTAKSNHYRCETEPTNIRYESITHTKKEEFLFSHKSSLETLLAVIKTAQITFLSNILTKNKKTNKKTLKKILTELNDNLNSMYKEQYAKIKFFEMQIIRQKTFIQNELFEKKKKNKNYQNKKEELEQLKILNFKVQNDIKLIDNLIIKNLCIEQYMNKNIIKYEEEKEINCLKPKNYGMISFILHRKNIEIKRQFKNLVADKQHQNDQMSTLIKRIDQLKYLIYNKENGYNNYIYAEDIIPEESKEYTKSMTINNINSTINKIIFNSNNKNIINLDNDEFNSDNSSINSIQNNLEDKNDDNKLNNLINVNMNINFNFNFDKIYNITDDIKYNSDREIKNKDKNILNLKNKKGFASTGSLPYLIIKSIQEEKATEKHIEKGDIYKNKNKSVINDILSEEFIPTA